MIGQSEFTFGIPGAQQNLMTGASGLAYANGLLFVADSQRVGVTAASGSSNNRVLAFDTTQIPDAHADPTFAQHPSIYCWLCGYNAVNVLGQPDFTSSNVGVSNQPTTSAGSMHNPVGVATDGQVLAISDTDNNRVLIWNTIPTAPGQPANVVLGAANFTTPGSPTATPTTMAGPQGLWIQNGKLYVADVKNYRILIWNHIPTQNNQPADMVLGQSSLTSSQNPCEPTKSNYTVTASVVCDPVSVTSDGTHLFVADLGFNRVLIWNSIPTSNNQPADVVVGQPDMASGVADNPAVCNGASLCGASLNFPRYALSDGKRLFIADGGDDRVLVFNSIPTANGATADAVLGQPDFTSDIITNQPPSIVSTTIDNTAGVDTIATPISLAWDGSNLYVSDPFNRRVLLFAPGDTSLPDNSVVNWASEIIRQEGVVSFSNAGGGIVANDTATVTIAGTAYSYTVKSGDTLDGIAQALVNAINANNGDPNATAIFAGAGTASIYLSSKGINLAFDAISLAASTSNTADIAATTSGGFLSAGTGATGAPGMLVEINSPNGGLSDQTNPVTASTNGASLPLTLGGAQVFMDGIPSPLMSVSATQIVTQIPYFFGDRNSASIYVRTTHNDGSITITNATPTYIAPANPGIFNAPGVAGQQRPWPIVGATHQAGNATAVVSIDGTAHAGDIATITIAGTNYNYTVQANDTLSSIVNGLVNAINASDPNVTAEAGGAFTRVVLTAKQAGAAGSGISIAGSASSSAQVTVTAYTSSTCCDVTPGSTISPSNPAAPGELISISAAGLGLFSDAGVQAALQAGQPYSGPVPNDVSNSVSATMNGQTAQVIFAGVPSGSYGVYQIQMIVPSGLPTNSATQLYIAQNAFVSNLVTIPIGPASESGGGVPPATGLANAQILVSPINLVFANQSLVSTSNLTQTVTVTNPGTSALGITGVQVTGANAGNFQAANSCGSSLAANSTCTVSITYTPSGSSVQSASLVISSTATVSPQRVSLTGATVSQYEIINKLSGKALDVTGASSSAGAIIDQTTAVASTSQQWKLVPVGNGYYSIMNVNSGKVLDVTLGSSANGAVIQQYDYLGSANQLWTLTPTGGGYYAIVSLNSGKVLDVTDLSTADGAVIQQWDYLGDDNQKWQLTPALPQYYAIANLNSGKVLDVTGGSSADGTLIQQWDYLGGTNQQWQLVPVDSIYYMILNRKTGKVLDVIGQSTAAGAQIQQYTYLGGTNQLWALVPVGGGNYAIVNKGSGRVLDVTDVSTSNGAVMQQYDYLGGANQQWQLAPVGTPGQ